MVEYSVQNDTHPAPVYFLTEVREPFIAGFKIFRMRRAAYVERSLRVITDPGIQDLPLIPWYDSQVWIDVFIILRVVFMPRRRNKYRVEIDHLDTKRLQIVQLLPNTYKIPAIQAAIEIKRKYL